VTVGKKRNDRTSLAVLHTVFALTGVLHAIIGALLPSLASTFRLTDSRSGTLALAYFFGTSVGALLCVVRYVRLMTTGFLVVALTCFAIAAAGVTFLPALFLALGIGVGIPMTAVSMYAGRRFGDLSAAPLTLLNFSWSLGAFLSPLFAARVLVQQTYRTAYEILGAAAAVAALACLLALQDTPSIALVKGKIARSLQLRWIALFALLTFLEVGVENTTATWLATYALRGSHAGAASAVATSSLYWCGFLASRGFSSVLLLRVAPMRVLRAALATAFAAAVLLVGLPGAAFRDAAMLVLGAALAPIFPLLMARFFASTYNASDSRWVLATCGLGGSVLPWLTGWISANSHSLRIGLATVPTALLLMLVIIFALRRQRESSAAPGLPGGTR
jgi:FHS family glucose/mannose:H+ symporter-like MFS transporter